MRTLAWKSTGTTAAAIFGMGLFLSAAPTPPRPQTGRPAVVQEITFSVDPAQSKVHFMVDTTLHTVHGTFTLKNGAIHFDPETGKAAGEIVVFAASADSGNSSRDEKLHKEVLECAKYPDAIFRPTQIEGKISAFGSSDVKLYGTFVLHGGSHDIVVPVHAELHGDSWKGTGKFDIPYVQWGLKNPSNFVLKVQPVVNVDLDMTGSLKTQNR